MVKTTFLTPLYLFISLSIFGQEIPIPKYYSIVQSVKGDLDNDTIEELAVAYNTLKQLEEDGGNSPRELILYKKKNNIWIPWKKSTQALFGSDEGGIMGDPFEEMSIEKNVLFIRQSGGSSWKWGHTDKYRFQNNDFYLIGYESFFGKYCNYWKKIDFNISTGKIIFKSISETCNNNYEEITSKTESETFYTEKLKITLANRREKSIMITSPKYKEKIYIATKQN